MNVPAGRNDLLFFTLFLGVNFVFQGFAGLERRSLGSSDLDLGTGARITCSTGGTLFHIKGTEANQLNLFALGKSAVNSINESVQSLFGVLLGELSLLGQCVDQFTFVHD